MTFGCSVQEELRILQGSLIVLHNKHCILSLRGIAILAKDLLSTLHLLVAIAKHFQPNLAFPPNVHVETITIEVFMALIFVTENPKNISQDLVLFIIKETCVCNNKWETYFL